MRDLEELFSSMCLSLETFDIGFMSYLEGATIWALRVIQ